MGQDVRLVVSLDDRSERWLKSIMDEQKVIVDNQRTIMDKLDRIARTGTPDFEAALDAALQRMEAIIMPRLEEMMAKAVDAVTRANTVMDSGVEMVSQLRAMVQQGKDDLAAGVKAAVILDGLASGLDKHSDALVRALVANTEAAPPGDQSGSTPATGDTGTAGTTDTGAASGGDAGAASGGAGDSGSGQPSDAGSTDAAKADGTT